MNRRLMVLAVAVVVAASSTLSACAGDESPSVVTDGDSFAVISSSTSEGMDALLQGDVAIEEGCWGVADETGAFHQVVWPAGTDLGQDGLRLPEGGDALTPGVAVDVAGGQIELDGFEPPDCWDPSESAWLAWRVER